jgi:phage tail sheath protein FI
MMKEPIRDERRPARQDGGVSPDGSARIRRLLSYLERSIEKDTQFAVFEPNDERLWDSVRRSIEDFLHTVWSNGALEGSRPEEAYFVRCDRTTMTQDDLDNGRLVCLVGVAPVKSAEFEILQISQSTGDTPTP